VSLSLLAGILNMELIEAAETTVSTLQPEAVAPLGTEDETLGLTARLARSVPGFTRLAGPARKGGCRDLQVARPRNTPNSFAPQWRPHFWSTNVQFSD
jgi:hypothetical protein